MIENLEQIAAQYRRALPMDLADEFPIEGLDRIGQPLWAVAIWAPDGFYDGFGYGPDELGAQVSALGEAAENCFASREIRKKAIRRASFNALVREGSPAQDPVTLCLDAGCGYTPDRELFWVEAKRYPSGESVLVPVEAAAIAESDIPEYAQAKPFLMWPVTNGLGAGISLEQALTHGVLECVQRDGDSVTFRALDQGIAVELDDVQDGRTLHLLKRLKQAGIDVTVKLASTDFGILVLYAVGRDRDIHRPPFPLMLSACGEAAHPDRERALAKALQEYISSRSRKRFMHGPLDDVARIAPKRYMERLFSTNHDGDESRALQSVMEWVEMPRDEFFRIIEDPVLKVRSTVKFSSLPTSTKSPLNIFPDILYVDFSANDIHVVKAIVPTLEVETMSYGRIGDRNLDRLLARGVDFVGLGQGSSPLYLPSGRAAWLDPAKLDRAVGKLYGLYREPNGHTIARIREGR